MLALVSTAALSFLVPPAPSVRVHTAPAALRVAPLSMAESPAAGAEELCDIMPASVCEEIYSDADAVFSVIDENGDGSISLPELKKHLLKSGYNEVAVEKVFAKLDIDGDGEITPEELRQGFLQYTPLRSAPGLGAYNSQFIDEIHEDADTLFNSIDADGSGEISKEELREHLKTFTKYSYKAISKIFKLLDVNKDGDIEKKELRRSMAKVPDRYQTDRQTEKRAA